MGFEMPQQNLESKIAEDTTENGEINHDVERIKTLIKKALNRVAIFVMAGMMLEASGVSEFVKIELGLTSKEKIEQINKEKKIEDVLGREELSLIAEAVKTQSGKVKENQEIDIDKLPSADGEISEEQIGEYLSAFPKHWVNGEVRSIKFRDREGVTQDTEGTYFNLDERSGPIEFYNNIEEDSVPRITYALAHEVAHANDWLSDNELSYDERLNLILKLIERISAVDRYKSDYVESIDSSFAGKGDQAILGRKVREYWAEIAAVYFLDPSVLDIKDFSIVDSVVRENDPDYRPGTAREKRIEVIKKIIKDKNILKIYGFDKN